MDHRFIKFKVDEEKTISGAIKAIAQEFGRTKQYREFSKRLKGAEYHAANRAGRRASKEFTALQKEFPEFWQLGAIVSYVYRVGQADGLQGERPRPTGGILMYGLTEPW